MDLTSRPALCRQIMLRCASSVTRMTLDTSASPVTSLPLLERQEEEVIKVSQDDLRLVLLWIYCHGNSSFGRRGRSRLVLWALIKSRKQYLRTDKISFFIAINSQLNATGQSHTLICNLVELDRTAKLTRSMTFLSNFIGQIKLTSQTFFRIWRSKP
jgi:hypothetical protein